MTSLSKYPSCVSMPHVAKPYPSILTFLAQRFPAVELATWELRILQGKVLDAAGAPITSQTPYAPQQKLYYFREVVEETLIPLAEKILFQNDEILVACKPPFLPVTPTGPYVNECLLNRLKNATGNSALVPLHRIDRETAGLVLFSANSATRGRYGQLFATGQIEKTYEAVAELAECPQQRDWTVANRLTAEQNSFRMQVVPGAINARSQIRLLEFKDKRGYFQLSPLTGKKHQLRLHMCGLGFGLRNDRFYPQLLPKQADDLNNPLQLLARRLKFIDPVSAKSMEFVSERKLCCQDQ